jgi:hypothetical protein
LVGRNTSNLKMPMVNGLGDEAFFNDLCIWIIKYMQQHSLRNDNVFWRNQSFTNSLCGDPLHGKVWNVAVKYMERRRMWQTFIHCNGDYGEKLKLEIKVQQLTLDQDKQHEHNLNPTLWQRKTPSPRK